MIARCITRGQESPIYGDPQCCVAIPTTRVPKKPSVVVTSRKASGAILIIIRACSVTPEKPIVSAILLVDSQRVCVVTPPPEGIAIPALYQRVPPVASVKYLFEPQLGCEKGKRTYITDPAMRNATAVVIGWLGAS